MSMYTLVIIPILIFLILISIIPISIMIPFFPTLIPTFPLRGNAKILWLVQQESIFIMKILFLLITISFKTVRINKINLLRSSSHYILGEKIMLSHHVIHVLINFIIFFLLLLTCKIYRVRLVRQPLLYLVT